MQTFTKTTASERVTPAIMLVLTATYLLVELGFNARLLDTVGGTATVEEIDSIEVYGRWISGAALTLFFWSGIFKKAFASKPNILQLVIKMVISAAVCCATMYAIQEAIIRTIVAVSSGETRARAAVLVPLAHILTKENVLLTGLEVTPQDYQTPEGKSFLATFALQALAVPEFGDKMRSVADAMFGLIAEEARGGGGRAHLAYVESQRAIEKQFEGEYASGNRSYQTALDGIPARQKAAWADYERSLAQKRWTPATVPSFYAGSVRSNVQKKVPVPNNWRPSDRATFNAVVAQRVQLEALEEFEKKSNGVPPNLMMAQFMLNPNVQIKWRDALKISGGVRLTPNLSEKQFAATVFDDIIASDVRKLKADRMAVPQSYAEGGLRAALGRDSIRALAVPPIALFFSLIGALTHLFKCILWAVKIFSKLPSWAVLASAAVYFGLVIIVPYQFTNRFTDQPLFKKLEGDTRAHMPLGAGYAVAGMLRWAVQMQHYFYPVNEHVRVNMLGGMRFGYHDPQSIDQTNPHTKEK